MNKPATVRKLFILICIALLICYAFTIWGCSAPNDLTRNPMQGEVCGKFIKAIPISKGGYKYLFLSETNDTLVEKSPVYRNYKIGKYYPVRI